MKKDEAIRASGSSHGVEKDFAGLTQSFTESCQKYEKDKEIWETQSKSIELERDQAVIASKDFEKKLNNSEQSNKDLEAKLKLAESEVARLKGVEQQKNKVEERLKSAEELFKEKVSSEKAKRKAAVKKSFSARWDKG